MIILQCNNSKKEKRRKEKEERKREEKEKDEKKRRERSYEKVCNTIQHINLQILFTYSLQLILSEGVKVLFMVVRQISFGY